MFEFLDFALDPIIVLLIIFQIDSQRNIDDQLFQGFYYTPVIEFDHSDAVITQNMHEAFEKGLAMRVPLLTGICSEESIGMASGKAFGSIYIL